VSLPCPDVTSWLDLVPEVDGAPPPVARRFRGGRAAALERLAGVDPRRYAATRNHVDGAVTALSPWLRHGVLSLAEVRDAALERAADPAAATTLVRELAWRDYWQRVQAALGERIGTAVERPAALPRRAPSPEMPDDVRAAATGMACIDDFIRRLQTEGWLHNHERMWLASWLTHARGVAWRTGADWFLSHLLDGDPASNHLSWQWVAGTFSAKPYLFNRENLETFTAGAHCGPCPVRGRCDMEGGYDELSARLFDAAQPAARAPLRIRPTVAPPPSMAPRRPLVWITLDSASPTGPAVVRHPDAPRVFGLDPAWLAAERPAVKRLVFLLECLAEVPDLEVLLGDPAALLLRRAAELDCDSVAVAETPCPRVRRGMTAIAERLPVAPVSWPRFCDQSRVRDLGRFSRWWTQVAGSALAPTCLG